ncbi:MAG TPA: hypothetical protein VF310_02865 [Vicinamibacteria bacterium]
MRAPLAACALLACAAAAATQTPQQQVHITGPEGTSEYGEPVFAELSSIAFGADIHQRQHVRTRGRLEPLDIGHYFLLTEGSARVLVLFAGGAGSETTQFLGHDVDTSGVVRTIRKKEYVGGVDLDLIEDPTLPVLPAPRNDWPKVSLTVLGMSFREGGAGRRGGATGRSAVAELLANPPAAGTKAAKVVIMGVFRGRNLFGDLPAASQRKPGDWVLKDGEQALWVTGKEPKGKGWALDPDYRADTARWLEVEGRPEVVNGIVYLEASALRLVKRPADTADEPRP